LQQSLSELSGEVFVVADVDTNSLLVTTASKYESRVRKIIDELDRSVPQVLIKVLVAEVTHDDGADLGADFSILNRRANGNGQSGGTNFGNAAASGGLIVSILETNFTATLRALASTGKLDVLSRPYILASDNQLATINVGQSVPRVISSRITETGQTISEFEYRDVGIILEVTPHINPDGKVILDVSPEVSQLTDETVEVSPGVSPRVINQRFAESRVAVMNGQTIVIGGLMEDRKSLTVDKVPFLGDLPLLKYAFSRTRQNKAKTELLIFLTPHVAEEAAALRDMSQDETDGTVLTPNAVEPGMFQEHLRGLKRGANPTTNPAGAGAQSSYRPIMGPDPATPTTPMRPLMIESASPGPGDAPTDLTPPADPATEDAMRPAATD
jgi:general secretion pathway protein D